MAAVGAFFTDIFAFGWLVILHWGAYVIGGAPWVADEALKRLSDRYTKWSEANKPLRRRVEVGALLAGLLFASFQAWNEEHSARGVAELGRQSAEKQAAVQKQRADDFDTAINGKGGYKDQVAELKNKPPIVRRVLVPPSAQSKSNNSQAQSSPAQAVAAPSAPSTPTERHLSNDEKKILISGSAEFNGAIKSLRLYWVEMNGETLQFSRDFMDAFGRAGLKPDEVPWNPDSPDQIGVMIGAGNPLKPNTTEKKLHALLLKIGIDARFIAKPTGEPDTSAIIFIGPLPL